MTKIMIGTPAYGCQVTLAYLEGILDLQKHCLQKNIPIEFSFIYSDSLITRARNSIVKQFLDSDCSHLIFIDADIGFSGNDVQKLLDCNLDFVCGLYPLKMIDWQNVREMISSNTSDRDIEQNTSPAVANFIGTTGLGADGNHIAEIRHGGTGFMCLTRRVFNDLSGYVKTYQGNRLGELGEIFYEFFTTTVESRSQILLSEDYYFCDMWRNIGGKLFARTDINLRHVGNFEFSNNVKYIHPPPDPARYR